jgi:K+-sensing histidine kinase KdpD/DNA-binding response OmpR family regulator
MDKQTLSQEELEQHVSFLSSQLNLRTEEIAVINAVQEGLAKKMDIQGIYDLVGDKLVSLFEKANAIIIAAFDYETTAEVFKYAIEKGERVYPNPRSLDRLRSNLIDTKKKILIRTSAESFEWFQKKTIAGTLPLKSGVFIPLIINEKVVGYISLQNVDEEQAFSDSDVQLLETLANSMSVALENVRLFDETNRLLKETEQGKAELAVINSVQEGLAREMDIQGIYTLVGNRIRALFNAQAVLIATFDHERKMELFNFHIEKGEISSPKPRPYDKVRQHLIDTGQNILINENFEKAAAEFGMKVLPGTGAPKSLLFMPMKVGDKVTGYVSLQNIDEEHAFSFSDVRLLSTLANSMSVALQNARLFDETVRLLKETEQQKGELSVINSIQEGLARELDMDSIYELVGDRLCKLFPATHTLVIRTFDHENGIEQFQYAIEKNIRYNIEPKPILWANKQLIANKKTLYINENFVETAKRYGGRDVTTGEPPKSAVFVPMIVGDVVKGSISLQNVDKENAFSEADIRLLTTVTHSMSVALENARLFDETNRLLKETEQRNAELAVINSVQESLVAQMDMNAIYELVGDKMREIFDVQVIDIVTYDKQRNLIEDRYAFEKGDRTKLGLREPKGIRKHVIESKQSVVINDDMEKAQVEYDNVVLIGDPAKSGVFVPMIAGGEVTGVISLQNLNEEHAFSESDVSLLSTLTNSMSVALESARLFDEMNRLLKETEQRKSELAVINGIQEGLVGEMDMQAIYNLVGDRLCKLFPDTQTLVIRTFDHEAGNEHWEYAIEKGIKLTSEPRPFNWANQRLIATKQPLHINRDYLATAKKYGGKGVTKGRPPKSAVFVPMIVGEVVKGSVSLQNVDAENAFTDSDVKLLATITNSMTVALENARLFEETHRLLKETEQRTAELAVINSVQDGLVREMDMQGIYETVGDRLCTLFNTQTVIIRTFEHEAGEEVWQYAIEKGTRLYSEPRAFIWANKRLIETKKPLIINVNYVETAQKYGGSGVSKGQPPKSAVFVPMIVGEVVKGSVSLQNIDIENAFSDSDIRLLTTLVNSMSVALENARLFDETAHLLGEAKQRAAELTTVNTISKALASQLDADQLIQFVGDQMRDLFKANIVYVALLNEKTQVIHFPYQYGDNMQPLKLGEGLTSKIITSGRPLLMNKDVQEMRLQLGVQLVGLPAASYLGVPIPVGDKIIGVLSVQSTEQENRFNLDDQRLLSTIAASVGVAIKNATLFDEVKQAKLEAENAGKAAEKANAAKSAFLSTVSHELRTPLTSVLGFAKIIRKRLEEKIFPTLDSSDVKIQKTVNQVSENLNVVVSEGERLTHLINDVLDLAKIEAGKMEWNFEDVSLSEVADRAISATTSLFEQKSLILEMNVEKDLPLITGDRDKLIQVMINLISNAVKFTERGCITCKVYRRKGELIASIVDTGIGIATEDHAAVFEQFKQVGGDTLTDKPKGTGLGLPICKEIIEHHGGKIWLESTPGEGSSFSFSLPITKVNGKTKPVDLNKLVEQLKEQMAQSSFQSLDGPATILIVDDDDSIRSLLLQELSEAGYLIEQATNGREALEMIRLKKPDLLILDVMMPEMNGFDLAAILKNDPQTMDIPIIILSIVQDKIRGYKIGVDRYLNKPIDTAQLFTEVGALLEQGKSKKKVMVVDEDTTALRTLTDVLETKGYHVVESNGKELIEKAIKTKPDIIILNSNENGEQELIRTLRFQKGLENVLFLYQ